MKVLPKIIKAKKSQKYLVALDIGTEFVKALICQVKDGGLEVVGVGRKHQGLSDMQSGAITDISSVSANCEVALAAAEKMSGVSANQAVVGIAGELVKGTSTVIKYRRHSPESVIELSELQKILEKVQAKSLEQARSQLSWETGYPEVEVKIVNTAVVDVHIDGYRVTNPLGFQGRDVTIQVFTAFAPMVHLGALQRVARQLDLELLSVAAEPFAVAKAVAEKDSNEFSAIFIDVGGGTTDIALVDNGGVEGTKMFAIGGRSFTKRLAQVANVGFEEAEKMKLDYAGGLLKGEAKELVADALVADVRVWLSGVELSLSEFDKVDHLPAKILLCGGGTGLPEIAEALKGDWYKRLPFARRPSVDFISPKQVSRIKDSTNQLVGYADITPMALANIGLDVLTGAGAGERLMQKLSRMIEI